MEIKMLQKEDLNFYKDICPQTFMAELADGDGVVAFGAEHSSEAAGILVAGSSGNGLYIYHLYVNPFFRRMGIGTALVDALFGFCEDLFDTVKCVFTPVLDDMDADPYCNFFREQGFNLTRTAGRVYSVRIGEMADNPLFNKERVSKLSLHSFVKAPKPFMKAFIESITEDGYTPFSIPDVLQEASFIVLSGNVVEGAAVIEHYSGQFELSFLYCRKTENAPNVLPQLLRAAYSEMSKNYPPETIVKIKAVADKTVKLTNKMCSGASYVTQVEGVADVAGRRIAKQAIIAFEQLLAESD